MPFQADDYEYTPSGFKRKAMKQVTQDDGTPVLIPYVAQYGTGGGGGGTASSVAINDSSDPSKGASVSATGALLVHVENPSGGGSGGAATIADGADVAQGATTDAAYTTGAGTVISLLKGIF